MKLNGKLSVFAFVTLVGMSSAVAGDIQVVVENPDAVGIKGVGGASARYAVLTPQLGVKNTQRSKSIDIAASWAYCEELISKGLAKRGYCEPNFVYTFTASPNDPRNSSQYAHRLTSLPAAWDVNTGSTGVRVAIIDSGVQHTHPDLATNMWRNPNETVDGIDNDGNGFVDDIVGYDFVDRDADPDDLNDHGTHCAGITAAAGNNGEGVAGAAWNAAIMGVRVLDAQGSGFLSDVASGVRYAVDNGASVLSLSLGGPSASDTLERALSYACSKGAFIAVAAGNESADNDTVPAFPANHDLPCLISVAATDSSDNLADFSNRGIRKVHVAAPGVSILSTLPGGQYGNLSGTSMATPLVAGIGVLIKASKPELSGENIKSIVIDSVDKLGQLDGLIASGGRVNASNALALANGTTPTPPNPGSGSPGDSPGEEPAPSPEGEEDIEIDQATVTPSRLTLSGYVYTVEDEEVVEGQRVTTTCYTRQGSIVIFQAVSRATDEDGYFIYRFARRFASRLRSGVCALSTANMSSEVTRKLKFKRR
jgi:subtilisin family serine protease